MVLRKAWLPTVTPRESAVNIRSPHNTSDPVLLRGWGQAWARELAWGGTQPVTGARTIPDHTSHLHILGKAQREENTTSQERTHRGWKLWGLVHNVKGAHGPKMTRY